MCWVIDGTGGDNSQPFPDDSKGLSLGKLHEGKDPAKAELGTAVLSTHTELQVLEQTHTHTHKIS